MNPWENHRNFIKRSVPLNMIRSPVFIFFFSLKPFFIFLKLISYLYRHPYSLYLLFRLCSPLWCSVNSLINPNNLLLSRVQICNYHLELPVSCICKTKCGHLFCILCSHCNICARRIINCRSSLRPSSVFLISLGDIMHVICLRCGTNEP